MVDQVDQQIEQIYTKCLAQGAYFIESDGEAAVIDPLRETDPYLERAAEKGVKIKYIFETHFHADFVSGHLSLAKKTGAEIVYGPGAETSYDKYDAKDGETFKVGKLTIKVLHTPGHTPESTSYLLINEDGKQEAIFTGDTLFIGDVGRPDLAQKSTGLTSEDLAGWMYDSLREKIMPLDDHIIVYPAHGAGSACGKSMSKETFDTLGNQKKTNYALDPNMDKATFIKTLVTGLNTPPAYFSKNAKINKEGYKDYEDIMQDSVKSLSISDFENLMKKDDVMILDVRDKMAFAQKHIPGSICIGIDGGFAPWVGEIISDINQKLILVTPQDQEEEVITRLSRVGYDNTLGFLAGGIDAWEKAKKTSNSYETLDLASLEERYNEEIQIIDFRKPSEFADGHIATSKNIPLSEIHSRWGEIDPNKELIIHCRSGYRSTIAGSILAQKGYKYSNVVVLFPEIESSKVPTKS
ncbi:rhodanese-like domain-containing protein [Saprospiraceae bacterium]|nr:rhodanese-like domain-containing protein [Saprospiraceae bacterium]